MSKATHTEGPWTLRPVNEEIGEYEIVGPRHSDETGESEYIAVVCGGLPESKANARLIAAAPELLDALLAIEEAFVTDHGALNQTQIEAIRLVDAAIAKATGANH